MKTLVIHAGLPKTGSSALQVFLAQNYAALRRQSFDYFRLGEFAEGAAGKISSGNGCMVARSLLPDGAYSAVATPALQLGALARAVAASRCETGVISSEFFAHCDAARLAAWAASLRQAGCAIRVMYFIREQTQALSSMYVQTVKRSHCRETPEAYVARTYREVPYLDYMRFHDAQCEVFGRENVTCETYEAALQNIGGICEAFLTAIGADAGALPCKPETVNTGLSPSELAIMRELNKFLPHTRISDQVVDNARRAGHAYAGETYGFLPASLCREIEGYFATGNAELARQYFGRDSLFPAVVLSDDTVCVSEFSQTDLVNVLGGLLVRYDERLAALEARLAAQRAAPLRRLIRKLAPVAAAAGFSFRQ